jgi:hypothetical protein
VWGQIYLGGEGFRREMARRLEGRRVDSEIVSAQRQPFVEDVARIRRAVAAEFGCSPEALSRMRGGIDKAAAIYLTRLLTNLTGAQIGKEFAVGASQVSHAARRLETTTDHRLIRRMNALRKRIQDAS